MVQKIHPVYHTREGERHKDRNGKVKITERKMLEGNDQQHHHYHHQENHDMMADDEDDLDEKNERMLR